MVEKSLNRGRNESIFPSVNSAGTPIERSAHWQNIGDVVPDVDPKTTRYLNKHYGLRGGAMDWGKKVGLMVEERTPAILEQAAYLGATSGKTLNVWEIPDLQNGHHPADTLVVPYIHTQRTQDAVRDMGQESWGLPPKLVAQLKNKVNFHEAVSASGVEGFSVPDYKIATLRNVDKVAKDILRDSEAVYAEHDLSGRYPMGVVIRAEESDGNYGNVIIHGLSDGRIKVLVNGEPLKKTVHGHTVEAPPYRRGSWNRALHEAKLSLVDSTAKGINPRFVVSRFMDVADSPGMSLVLNKGYIESLGWNTQLQAEGTKQCIGTEKYQTNNPYLKRMQMMYEQKSAEDFAAFIQETAGSQGIPFESISGIINVDIMLPGPLEVELRRKRGIGDGYDVAECNARFTNYTDAALAAVGLTGLEPTPRNIQTVVWNGVTSIDRMNLRGASPEVVRAELFRIDQEAMRSGDPNRVFMRMPDSPTAGMILIGDKELAQEKVDRALNRARTKRAIKKAHGNRVYAGARRT
jgi:hypothetical protein